MRRACLRQLVPQLRAEFAHVEEVAVFFGEALLQLRDHDPLLGHGLRAWACANWACATPLVRLGRGRSRVAACAASRSCEMRVRWQREVLEHHIAALRSAWHSSSAVRWSA